MAGIDTVYECMGNKHNDHIRRHSTHIFDKIIAYIVKSINNIWRSILFECGSTDIRICKSNTVKIVRSQQNPYA